MDTGKRTRQRKRTRGPLTFRTRMMVYGSGASLLVASLAILSVVAFSPHGVDVLTNVGWGLIPMLLMIVLATAITDSLLLRRFFYRPMEELERITREVAQTRDLSARATGTVGDGVGRFSDMFNEMMSELQRSDRALRASEGRYRRLVETMTEGLAILDRKGRFLYTNERLGQLLGHSSESLIGAPLASQIAGSDADSLATRLCSGVEAPFELTLRHPDGGHRVAMVSSAPLRSDNVADQGTLVVLTDLTERKRSEKERASLGEQLRQAQKMEALGRLAGGVAHDFNNLLTGLDGNLELIRMDIPPDHVAMESVDEGRELVVRAATLTRQLLAMSRKQVLEPRVIDPNHTIRDLQKLLRRVIGEDLELHLELGAPPRIFADPGQLEQVLMNLAVNARDAMPRGGALTIRTLRETLDADGCRGDEELHPGLYAVLEVQDNGVGIPADLLEKIFEPFFTTKDRGRGTGLGLSTVYGIVRQHHGSVQIRTEVGRGSTFRVLIPETLRKSSRPPTTTTTHAIQAHKGTETILFVEDEPALRRAAISSLGRLGYKVLEAEDGDAGLAVAAQHKGHIDILITDVIMPGRNGRELADALRERQPDLPVLFTSGYAEDILGDDGLVGQEAHFLPKPYRLSTLARKVREILSIEGLEGP